MNSITAKNFIDNIFLQIRNSNSIADLENIIDNSGIPEKNKMNSFSYPKIDFQIDSAEIDFLIENGTLTNDLEFTPQITSRISDPLTKLLYSIVWKNGDLKKEKHIYKRYQKH